MASLMSDNNSFSFYDIREQFETAKKYEPSITPEKFADRCAHMTRETVMELLTGKSVFAKTA